MAEREVLRGKVTSYPADSDKGLVEVSIGAYDEENDTIYARVGQSMSGVYWLPEIGDVVEVELPGAPGGEPRILHIHRRSGDEQTGVCWTEENNIKQLLTRSGHRVTLDDTKDAAAVTVHTSGGLELRLEDKPQTVTLGADGTDEPILLLDMKNDEIKLAAGKKLTITCGGASIAFDSGGNLSVRAKGKLTLSGQEIDLDAKSKLAAKGQQAEVTGSMAAKVSGQSQLELTSGGITQVKGSMVKLN